MDNITTFSSAAVDRILKALVLIIAEQEAEISRLAPITDHSCAVVERQVVKLMELVADREHLCYDDVLISDITDIFSTDPADDKDWSTRE